MARSTLPLYPSDDGWPYPDESPEGPPETHGLDPTGTWSSDDDVDLDRLELIADPRAWDGLDARERHVVEARFGFDGPRSSMRELAAELGCTRTEAADVLGGAIDKLRVRLT